MRYLLIHGHIFDPRLDSPAEQWTVEKLDRISNEIDNPWLNWLRHTIADSDRDNEELRAGVARLGYSTICGHSHLPEATWNCGSWCGPKNPAYILFPHEKIALVSDLHLGSHEAKGYEGTLCDFFNFAIQQDWSLRVLGDCVDLWAHDPVEIWDMAWRPLDALHDLYQMGKVEFYRGNHDNDEKELRLMLNIPANKPIPWWAFLETEDTPELKEWR